VSDPNYKWMEKAGSYGRHLFLIGADERLLGVVQADADVEFWFARDALLTPYVQLGQWASKEAAQKAVEAVMVIHRSEEETDRNPRGC